jgi:hypothetical protein
VREKEKKVRGGMGKLRAVVGRPSGTVEKEGMTKNYSPTADSNTSANNSDEANQRKG